MINVSESGLMTIAGGKWTTYRAMAEETIDDAIKVFDLKADGKSKTAHIKLIGAHGWSPLMFAKLIQQVRRLIRPLDLSAWILGLSGLSNSLPCPAVRSRPRGRPTSV